MSSCPERERNRFRECTYLAEGPALNIHECPHPARETLCRAFFDADIPCLHPGTKTHIRNHTQETHIRTTKKTHRRKKTYNKKQIRNPYKKPQKETERETIHKVSKRYLLHPGKKKHMFRIACGNQRAGDDSVAISQHSSILHFAEAKSQDMEVPGGHCEHPVLNLRTTTSQKCEAVLRRARI